MSGGAITVLLVEDNPGDARLIGEELREIERGGAAAAFTLVCADRLAAALERLAGGAVDVVLLDLSLPDGQGLDTLARMREAAPSTPVLVLTGLDDQELAARAVREGAQDYLVKGRVDGGVLGRTIRYAMERGRLLTSERAARAEAENARGRAEQANLELVRLAAEAEAANRAKSAFLAVMSHELRTPLNAIVGYTQLLEMGLHGPVTNGQREALQRIRTNQARLLSLVTQILDYAKLESGQLRLDIREVATSELFAGIDDTIRPQVRAKGLCFECCWDCDREPVRADGQRVQQILLNLASNAVKFTDPGGTIRVSCESVDGRVAIHVRDTGRGIPADKIESVFEPFVQVEQELTRSAEGAGLGLAISRDLAKAMGGDLTVVSAPGRGSTFTLWLPIPRRAEAALRSPRRARSETPSDERALPGRGVAAIGDHIARETESIVEAIVRRLRADPLTPQAHGISTLQLQNHVATFLTDLGTSLHVIAMTGGDPSQILRDGTEIQRVLSERHGAQRARLGWTEDALAREFQILREEVEACVRRGGAASDAADVDSAISLLRSLLEHAERISLRGMRSAPVTRPA